MKFWRRPYDTHERFSREIMSHIDSAYNLARWLSRNDDDAADIVQEASVRAFKSMDQCGAHPRAWFLTIIRNTAFSYMARRQVNATSAFMDEAETIEWSGPSPEQVMLSNAEREMVTSLIEELPAEFREVVILRDIEDLSYKEIAEITGTPLGTVMSRLNRARQRLQQRLADRTLEERKLGL